MSTLPAELRPLITRCVAHLRGAQRLLFITGAGLSADSGLPTYRGLGGLYQDRDTEEGLPIEELLSGRMLRRRPEWTWKYLMQVEEGCRQAKHNRAHEVIAEMEAHFPAVWVLTQNIDGFHQQAGSKNVIDIHGDLHHMNCMQCAYRTTVPNYEGLPIPPSCPSCGGTVRPGVVLFGEQLPDAQLALYDREMLHGFDVVFSIGTTSVFPYIAAPVVDAYHKNRPSIEINPGETEVSEMVAIKIPFGAAATLDAMWREYQATT
jgi:NAD-dependent deacetylase